jgi:hypothetical protein
MCNIKEDTLDEFKRKLRAHLRYLEEMIIISDEEARDNNNDGWTKGYAMAQESAYKDAYEELRDIIGEVAKVSNKT